MNYISLVAIPCLIVLNSILIKSLNQSCYVNRGHCPQGEYEFRKSNRSTYCVCSQDKDITCKGTKSLELVFATLSNQLHHSLSYFESLIITDCNSDTFNTNLFNGIKFKRIIIKNCTTIKHFSAHIFGGTTDTLQDLDLQLTKNSSSDDSFWEDVFHSIGHLSQLKRLTIYGFKYLTIPDLAIKSLSSPYLKIKSIYFNNGIAENDVIDSIGTDSFADLVDLELIDFSNVEIISIKEFAFRISHSAVNELNIILSADKILKTNFDQKSLLASNRKINLIITSPQQKPIEVRLNKIYLEPFLADNQNINSIIINTPIDCNQTLLINYPSSWILDRYEKQVFGNCSDGIDLIEKLKLIHNSNSKLTTPSIQSTLLSRK